MDDNKQQDNNEPENLMPAIQERIASLDEPVRNLLLSDNYVIKLGEIGQAHNLNPKNMSAMEELTTNFLLGVIRPKDLEQNFIEDLSELNKEKITSLFNDIKSKILNPVWPIVESAWAEDDENEEIWNHVLELSEIPLPPQMQKPGINTLGEKINNELDKGTDTTNIVNDIRPGKVLTNEEVEKLVKEENKEIKDTWSNKKDTTNEPVVTTRQTNDVSLPKIKSWDNDQYREIPE